MRQYTATELDAIRKLSVLEDQDNEEEDVIVEPTQEGEESEDGLFDLSELFGQQEEVPLERLVESSYLQRMQTGRGLYKLHGQSEPTRIFW
jgi:hypothetical protein